MTDEEKECVKLWLEKPDTKFIGYDDEPCEGGPDVLLRIRNEGVKGSTFGFQHIGSFQHIRRIPEPKPVEMRYMTPLEAGDFALEHAREIEVRSKFDGVWLHALSFHYAHPDEREFRYRGQTEVHEFKVPKEKNND